MASSLLSLPICFYCLPLSLNPFNTPSAAHKNPAAMTITPYLLSPHSSAPLLPPLSFTSIGEKRQGHEDKHDKSESGCV